MEIEEILNKEVLNKLSVVHIDRIKTQLKVRDIFKEQGGASGVNVYTNHIKNYLGCLKAAQLITNSEEGLLLDGIDRRD